MASAGTRGKRAASTRATRAKPTLNYAEASSSSESENDHNDSEVEITQPPPCRPQRTIPNSRSSRTRNKTGSSTLKKKRQPTASRSKRTKDEAYALSDGSDVQRTPKKRKTSKPSTPKSTETSDVIVGSGVVPLWHTLPYHVLVQIFRFATHPLYDERTFQPFPSGRWLLSVARLCRDFAEPAFTVLYNTPPLVPMVQAHRLVDLLKTQPIGLAFKYRQKVESLRIDVGQVAAYSLPGSGLLDLYGLIKDLPRLVDLEFYHQKDMSPYRDLEMPIKWTYPEEIFDALEYVDPAADPDRGDKTSVCKLRSWRWSSRMAGRSWSLTIMPTVHMRPCFENLQKIAFVNYQMPNLKKDQEDPKHEDLLAAALSPLKNLTHLIFESSTLVNHKLLPLLPKGIRNFELINCWEVTSDDFMEFLNTHGNQFRCLTLNHNQSLSLGFLQVLGSACPHMQILRMNFTYYNLHTFYRDSEPMYQKLILPSEVPDWPRSLQVIEMTQMRQWETEAAEMFFQSLLNSAGTLPVLRKLSIQAILNIGWRDRAAFRDKWIGSINRVFKRVSIPPTVFPSINTLAALSHSEPQATGKAGSAESIQAEKIEAKTGAENTDRLTNQTRTSNRDISSSSSLSSESHQIIENRHRNDTNTEKEEPRTRRSQRDSVRQVLKGTYAESPENSESEEPSLREQVRQKTARREIANLRKTAGVDAPPSSPPRSNSDSEDSAAEDPILLPRKRYNGKGEVIQGMCEIVEVRIDNLRPAENQVTERDFLDEEQPGDGDWNGDDEGEDEYAW